MKMHLLVCAALLVPAPLLAQSVAPAPATYIAPLPTNRAILRTGTELPLRLSEEITTKGKKLRVGQRVHMESAEAVFVQGVNVIPVGSPAMGEITDVTNKGMWGKSGHVAFRALYVMVNGRQIRLSGAIDDKGVAGGIGAVAVSAVVFLPAGFFMTGTSAKIPAGTVVKAFVDEDVPLELAPAALPAMVVGGPTPSVPVAAAATGSAPVAAAATASAPVATTASASAQSVSMVVPATGSASSNGAGALQVGGPQKLKAKTPSGFCYDVPKSYTGLGTVDKPVLTTAIPGCWEVATGG